MRNSSGRCSRRSSKTTRTADDIELPIIPDIDDIDTGNVLDGLLTAAAAGASPTSFLAAGSIKAGSSLIQGVIRASADLDGANILSAPAHPDGRQRGSRDQGRCQHPDRDEPRAVGVGHHHRRQDNSTSRHEPEHRAPGHRHHAAGHAADQRGRHAAPEGLPGDHGRQPRDCRWSRVRPRRSASRSRTGRSRTPSSSRMARPS